MSIYAISDLHLSHDGLKPMEVFGEEWAGHKEKIEKSWRAVVKPSDCVIIAGDVSWAMNLAGAEGDLSFIDGLPGKKLLVRGNHDYWWHSLKKNRDAFPDIGFIQNDYFLYGEYAICGTRGWLCPNSGCFLENDSKIYHRELRRLETSFSAAYREGFRKFICVTHYPPVNYKKEHSGFSDIIMRYGADYAVFGHLHGEDCNGWENVKIGECTLFLTSCDYLNFEVKLISADAG